MHCAKHLQTLRKFPIYVTWVNKVHCYIIFSLKITAISGAILNGYAAIAHFWENPMFGLLHYVITMFYKQIASY